MTDLFPSFETHRVALALTPDRQDSIEIFCRRYVPRSKSAKPSKALLLVHGHPQTHHIWHRVAAQLVEAQEKEQCEIVVVDTRGMGQSSKPPIHDAQGRSNYTKRRCGDDLVDVMRHFGHESFYVVGHDRGGRIVHRMLVDHGPTVIRSALILDIAPTVDMYRLADSRFGMMYWHWYFLAQPAPLPEEMLVAAPDTYFMRFIKLGDFISKPSSTGSASHIDDKDEMFHPTALNAYRGNVATMDSAAAMCEDYRASAPGGEDAAVDEQDRKEGKMVKQPIHLIWGGKGVIEMLYGGGIDLWQQRCEHKVEARSVPSGHYVPEKAPDEVVKEISNVLKHE